MKEVNTCSSRGPHGLLRVTSMQHNASRMHMATTVAAEVMRLARRGDVHAAVANLMIKGGHSAAVPARRTTRLSPLVQGGKPALRAKGTSTVGPPTSSCVHRWTVLADGGFSTPTVVPTIMGRVHGLHRCGGLGRPSHVPDAPIKGGSPPP